MDNITYEMYGCTSEITGCKSASYKCSKHFLHSPVLNDPVLLGISYDDQSMVSIEWITFLVVPYTFLVKYKRNKKVNISCDGQALCVGDVNKYFKRSVSTFVFWLNVYCSFET